MTHESKSCKKSVPGKSWTARSTYQSGFTSWEDGPFGALIGVALIKKLIFKTPNQKMADITVGEILIAKN